MWERNAALMVWPCSFDADCRAAGKKNPSQKRPLRWRCESRVAIASPHWNEDAFKCRRCPKGRDNHFASFVAPLCSASRLLAKLLTLSGQGSSRHESMAGIRRPEGSLSYVAAASAERFAQADSAHQDRLLAGAHDHCRHGDGLLHSSATTDGTAAAQ